MTAFARTSPIRRCASGGAELYAGPAAARASPVSCTRRAPPSPADVSARHALGGGAATTVRRTTSAHWRWRRPACEGLLTERPGERPFLVSRAGWAGMQRYGGAWCGPAADDWAGLRASLALVLGLGLCGVPYCGADVAGGPSRPGARTVSAGVPAVRVPAVLPFRLRTRGSSAPRCCGRRGRCWYAGSGCMPYLVTLTQLAQRTGAPYVRPRVVAACAGPGAARAARTRSCSGTRCWWRRCWRRAYAGGRCGCRAAAGTTGHG